MIILAHDYSYSILNTVYGVLPQNTAMTTIGDNVFIGMNAIILMGSHIGNNVIIGAGAVVSGVVEDDSVYAGNPARKICALEEFYAKRMKRFEESAVLQAKRIKETTGHYPTEEDMDFYAQLFNSDPSFYKEMEKRLGDSPIKLSAETKYKNIDEFFLSNKI